MNTSKTLLGQAILRKELRPFWGNVHRSSSEKNSNMLQQISNWALQEDRISTLLLVGSLARNGKQDELSDYDISVFGSYTDFASNDDWLQKISPILLCIHEQFEWNQLIIPTRLVIFENGKKADFAFHPTILLESMIQSKKLSATYDSGYKIILDKEGRAKYLPKATGKGYIHPVPTSSEFTKAFNEFWFEAYHVVKYLFRKDLWIVKFREGEMKKWLLKMLEWNAAVKSGFLIPIPNNGKNIRDWLSSPYYHQLSKCFSNWDQASGISALKACLTLFEEVAKETALIMQFSVDESLADGIQQFVNQLIPNSHAETKIKD
jgi:aminoglycoside 6-adenylyltransferase